MKEVGTSKQSGGAGGLKREEGSWGPGAGAGRRTVARTEGDTTVRTVAAAHPGLR